jgi:tetratricopeptide (TPR) repeat protein
VKKIKSYLFFLLIFLVCCIHHLYAQQQGQAKTRMDSILNVLQKQKDDSAKVINLMWVAQRKMGGAQNTGNWDEAIEWYQKSLNLSTRINFQYGIGRSNIFLGLCWMQKGDYAEAIKYFYAALNLSYNNGNKNLTVAASANLAGAYARLGNDKEALKYSLLSYNTTQELNNNSAVDLQQSAAGIAQLYATMQNWEEALSWYQKALPDNPDLFYEGDITLQIASIQMKMKRYAEALKNYRVAVQVFPQRFNRKPEADYKGLLGAWYQQLGEAYFKIGTLTKDSERTEAFHESINNLNKSLPLLSEGAGGKEALMNAYELLKQACEATNDYQNALRFTTLYNTLKDSIYNKTTYQKTADLQVKYETEKAASAFRIEQEKEKVRNAAILANQKLGEQKLNHERFMAEEKLNSEKSFADEKTRQEKLRAEKQQINNLLLMGLILVMITSVFVILYLRQRHQKKRAVEKAEAIHKMAELEMQSLRSQLNPHFMFNSLNSYLSRFARLLRMLLENAEKPFVSLQKEIDFIQLYLGLENLRVPDLQYSVFIDPSLNTEQTLIPNMILQPYVENAIWHGLSYKEADKQLQIRINRDNGTIKYEIEDNGVGRKKAEELKSLFRKQHQSRGMELLSKRFKLLNGEYNSSIETMIADVIKDNEVSGTLVTIKVPTQLSLPSQN